MPNLRFSLTALLAMLAVCAAALAAIRYGSPWIAKGAFTLETLLLSLALVGAIAAGGPRRVFCLGFFIFGWAYLTVTFPPRSQTTWAFLVFPTPQNMASESFLFTDDLIDWIAAQRPIEVGTHVSARWTNGAYYPARVTQVRGRQYRVAWDDGSAPLWVAANNLTPDGLAHREAGHCVFALLSSLLGGFVSLRLFAGAPLAEGGASS